MCLARYHAGPNVKFIFAFEKDERKRNFLIKLHGDNVQHVFGNVTDFQKGESFCYLQEKKVKIPDIDLLISGPVCKDLRLNQREPSARCSSIS